MNENIIFELKTDNNYNPVHAELQKLFYQMITGCKVITPNDIKKENER